MNAQTVWNEFHDKLRDDSFSENDFSSDMKTFLRSFLSLHG